MKEKRVFAMFITSAITLVASLAVTFGVLMTLADPVVATGITRYEFAFGATAENQANIKFEGNTLSLAEDIVFQPTAALAWDLDSETVANAGVTDTSISHPVWFDETTEGDITFIDESVSTRIKVIPFKISNANAVAIDVNIKVMYDSESDLGKYMVVQIYNFETGEFEQRTSSTVTVAAGKTAEYAVVVYADDTTSTGKSVEWGKATNYINVKVTNTTPVVG